MQASDELLSGGLGVGPGVRAVRGAVALLALAHLLAAIDIEKLHWAERHSSACTASRPSWQVQRTPALIMLRRSPHLSLPCLAHFEAPTGQGSLSLTSP